MAHILPVNHFDSATLRVDVNGVAYSTGDVPSLPIQNLQNTVRGDLWRSVDKNLNSVLGHWGGNARTVSAIEIWPSAQASSLIGCKIQFLGFSDAGWVNLTKNTGALDFFTPTGENYGTFLWGDPPWGVERTDRLARLAPFTLEFSAVTLGSFCIWVSAPAPSALDTPYFEARRIVLAEAVTFPFNAFYGAAPQWKGNSTAQRGPGGGLRGRRRAVWRELRFNTQVKTEADRAAWSDLMNVIEGQEVSVNLFPSNAAPRLTRDFVCRGRLEQIEAMPYENVEKHTMKFSVLES